MNGLDRGRGAKSRIFSHFFATGHAENMRKNAKKPRPDRVFSKRYVAAREKNSWAAAFFAQEPAGTSRLEVHGWGGFEGMLSSWDRCRRNVVPSGNRNDSAGFWRRKENVRGKSGHFLSFSKIQRYHSY